MRREWVVRACAVIVRRGGTRRAGTSNLWRCVDGGAVRLARRRMRESARRTRKIMSRPTVLFVWQEALLARLRLDPILLCWDVLILPCRFVIVRAHRWHRQPCLLLLSWSARSTTRCVQGRVDNGGGTVLVDWPAWNLCCYPTWLEVVLALPPLQFLHQSLLDLLVGHVFDSLDHDVR